MNLVLRLRALVRLRRHARPIAVLFQSLRSYAVFIMVASCFAAYGPNYESLLRRAAGTVDKILRGVNAGDIPVEQPNEFDLVINLKTAKALRKAKMTRTMQTLSHSSAAAVAGTHRLA
jgi:hypothetical protein